MERQRVNGKFYSETEPNREKLTVRVPESIYLALIDASEGKIPQFVREAIIEKLQRDTEKRFDGSY